MSWSLGKSIFGWKIKTKETDSSLRVLDAVLEMCRYDICIDRYIMEALRYNENFISIASSTIIGRKRQVEILVEDGKEAFAPLLLPDNLDDHDNH